MAAMAMHFTVAQSTVASLAPNVQFGCSALGGGGVVVGVHGSHPVECVSAAATAARGVWKRTHGRRVVVRAEAGGEVSAATATTTTAPDVTKGGINEVDKDTFWPIVKSAGQKVVVLDMYTQWCGPCKLILPQIQALAVTMDDVIFCKLDCNQANKSLAQELGIRAVPTFKIFKAGEPVTTITGAKYDSLVVAIEKARKGL